MNNLERIKRELESEAQQLGPQIGMAPERFLEAVLEIVDAEDKHRLSGTYINQQVRTIVLNAALNEE